MYASSEEYSTPLPFAAVTFFKNPIKFKTVIRKVKILRGKIELKKPKTCET
jgi:hypothetical protein